MTEEIVARMIERSGRSHELRPGLHVIGREGADLLIDHGDVSRLHAEIEVRSDGATIRDLGSKNGVRIGDVAVDVAPLHDGDQVRLGELCLTFEHHGARIDTLLRRSGEPTVRRVRQPEPELAPRAPTRQPSLLPPLLAAAAFALILAALLLT